MIPSKLPLTIPSFLFLSPSIPFPHRSFSFSISPSPTPLLPPLTPSLHSLLLSPSSSSPTSPLLPLHHLSFLPVQWCNQDAFGHVNNSIYSQWMEFARISCLQDIQRFHDKLSLSSTSPSSHHHSIPSSPSPSSPSSPMSSYMSPHTIGAILKSIHIKYRHPVLYPDHVVITSSLLFDKIQRDRFSLFHRIFSVNLAKLVAEGEGVIVSYDYQKGAKAKETPKEIQEMLIHYAKNKPGEVEVKEWEEMTKKLYHK